MCDTYWFHTRPVKPIILAYILAVVVVVYHQGGGGVMVVVVVESGGHRMDGLV